MVRESTIFAKGLCCMLRLCSSHLGKAPNGPFAKSHRAEQSSYSSLFRGLFLEPVHAKMGGEITTEADDGRQIEDTGGHHVEKRGEMP